MKNRTIVKRFQDIFSYCRSIQFRIYFIRKKLLVSAKLQNWIDNLITDLLRPITDKLDNNLNANVRAIAFNCFENLGTLEIDNYKEFISNIDDENKKQLSKLGIRIGAKYFFMPNLMKKKSIELNSLLGKF